MRTGTWAAPGRVNLMGEHTDYNDGFVLPIALPQTTRATVTLREDGEVRFASSGPGSGQKYAEAVFAAFRAEGYDVRGADIEVESDVPIGAGLSSSAALECALALAIDELNDLGLDRPALARIARRAENEFVGVPSGILDQSASLLCTEGHALLLDCRDGSTEQVAFDAAAAGLSLLVVDTRAHHELGDGQYAVRKRQCEEACSALGVDSLRDATESDLERLEGVLRRRARHIVTENGRVLRVTDLLRAGRLSELGPLLDASHASMRDDYEISAPELDVAVEAATEAGAVGARMTGGGFGGSTIALVEEPEAVRVAVREAFNRHKFREPAFLEALPSAGASRLDNDDAG